LLHDHVAPGSNGHDHAHDHDHVAPGRPGERPLRVGVGGPVGSGKTALVAALCRLLSPDVSIAVVTNDIFTREDAEALRRMQVLPDDRIVAVETGCCPHTAIRDDISANVDAIEQIEGAHPDVELTLVESGGDNLTAVFSRALVDLVINKTDLAPLVGADLSVMERDAIARRGALPIEFTSLVSSDGASAVAAWVSAQLAAWRGEVAAGR
jgi:urease accessory protein